VFEDQVLEEFSRTLLIDVIDDKVVKVGVGGHIGTNLNADYASLRKPLGELRSVFNGPDLHDDALLRQHGAAQKVCKIGL
jgi:hypothetical protein